MVLLILAILFSAASIFISFSALNLDVPQRGFAGQAIEGKDSGGLNLIVESSAASGGNAG